MTRVPRRRHSAAGTPTPPAAETRRSGRRKTGSETGEERQARTPVDDDVERRRKRVQLDELWGFIGAKAKTAKAKGRKNAGNLWTWIAIDPDTKLLISFLLAVGAGSPVALGSRPAAGESLSSSLPSDECFGTGPVVDESTEHLARDLHEPSFIRPKRKDGHVFNLYEPWPGLLLKDEVRAHLSRIDLNPGATPCVASPDRRPWTVAIPGDEASSLYFPVQRRNLEPALV